ncbi:tRNA lysidine(34) synthetase TilS [Cruoricaptor ignavus]|uniref:tRNA lysidine(34) synthetase TilS n=1 Tax=Cruoricaptor ignavus TaxID=1118202 RepID=UPI00370DC345
MKLTPDTFSTEFLRLAEDFVERKFLLGISGGADSMVLADLCLRLNLRFEIAHINYNLRGEDSEKDEALVRHFAEENGIAHHIYKVSASDGKPRHSVQIWARNLRYDFFFNLLSERNLAAVLTAHHLDDQLETFLINLSRGSGIKGLGGIPEKSDKILRPLLNFTKDEIYDYAEAHGVIFREDLSNFSDDYLRNRVRHDVSPKLKQAFPKFLSGFNESLQHLNSANAFIQREIAKAFSEIFVDGDDENFRLNREKLLGKDEFLSREIVRRLGFSGEEIAKVLSAESGKMLRSRTHEIWITRQEIICRTRSRNKQ